MHDFIIRHLAKIRPLEKEARLAYWEAAVSGNPSAYEKASQLEFKIREMYRNRREFELLKKWLMDANIEDPVLRRQLELLYNRYLENQIEPGLLKEMVSLGITIQQKFSTYQPVINGKPVTNNEILQILKTETDSEKRRAAWQASKQVGSIVADDIRHLVQLRNKAARDLGFQNYHEMALQTNEQSPAEIDALMDKLQEESLQPFTVAKQEIDRILAQRYGISEQEMKPWHYEDPFFQESPAIFQVNLDAFYHGQNVKKIAQEFFAGIQLPVDDILERSDLYERPGKNPHAFCEHIDREGDVRILCNLKNTETWMETILHELGHAVYEKYLDKDLPYLLREPAHIFTTEGIAMMFGRLSRNPYWMQKMLHLTDAQRLQMENDLFAYMRLKQLIFLRWSLVMYHFEKRLYQNPDQNVNLLWWQYVKKYQLLNPPDEQDRPDWASKIHFAIAPCYYHNYVLGEVFASQVHQYITRKLLKGQDWQKIDFVERPEIGFYLKNKIFKTGRLYHWQKMIEHATGEPLSANYYVEQFFQS